MKVFFSTLFFFLGGGAKTLTRKIPNILVQQNFRFVTAHIIVNKKINDQVQPILARSACESTTMHDYRLNKKHFL